MSTLTSSVYQAFLRLYKVFPAKASLARLLKLSGIPNQKFYRDLKFNGTFKVAMDNASFLMNHNGGTIENETFWQGLFATFEPDTGWIWKELCPLSDVIFDIGANKGIYSLVAKTINPKAKVYAFEPSYKMYAQLVLNNKLNGFDIFCESVALSNMNGEQVFYDTPDENQTSASLSAQKLKDWKGYTGEVVEYKVKTQTISSFIEERKISKIDLMKIDIEMHEPEAMRGMGNYILLHKPVILIEVLTDSIGEQLDNIFGGEFIRLHLSDNGVCKLMPQFKAIPDRYNYLVFHKSLEGMLRKSTTLKW